ncbi:MAG: bifunctional 4-hydroxy-2-oxoglutarate aldolase/2-dehydro-3-deoxy-phosphogluconate aldolase [Lachnospiraceae bacterium]|nr:bifunctional 4-hydroxy-2-oxoglutarate aldolase/2-dehydro-3-deoxy-phosphogluconate aldolase [Lachnospiraceae bacterium]
MDTKNALIQLWDSKLIAIFRGVPKAEAGPVARALAEGGIRFFEICLNHNSESPKEEFQEQWEQVRKAVGRDACVGAGTVLSVEQVEMVAQCGGQMIVSPCTNPAVIKRTKELGLICIPGAMTPTEITLAYEAGADMVKLYVVEDPHYVSMLRGPLGHIPMQVTCNVNLHTIPEFLKAGVRAFGTKAMLPDDRIRAQDYAGIKKLAETYVAAVQA